MNIQICLTLFKYKNRQPIIRLLFSVNKRFQLIIYHVKAAYDYFNSSM